MITKAILSLNVGSSGIKFGVFKIDSGIHKIYFGELSSGLNSESCIYKVNGKNNEILITYSSENDFVETLIKWLEELRSELSIIAIGHRVVYGINKTAVAPLNIELLEEFKKNTHYDADHFPAIISVIEKFILHYPSVQQFTCFDSFFHNTMPPAAKWIAIPRKYFNKGIQRNGFHGLSYSSVMNALSKNDSTINNKKIIIAHLGNGASIAAIKNGKCIDTSMGFTPASGIPMSTRSGDIDPAVAWYLLNEEKLDIEEYNYLINHQSGLLGISETTGDMSKLLELSAIDIRAKEAIDLFCYQCKKYIGAYAAILGGLDVLVFTGGIGQHSNVVRERICNGLEFLGVNIHSENNNKNSTVISDKSAQVLINVVPSEEEFEMAKLVLEALKN